jgi:hypothetical protein
MSKAKAKIADKNEQKIPKQEYGVEGVKGVKGAKPLSAAEASRAMLGDIYSGKFATKTESKSTSKKDFMSVPVHLQAEMKILVHGKRILKAIEKKIKVANDNLKVFFIEQWCRRYIKAGGVPPSAIYSAGELSIDFIQTKKIFLKKESVEQLKELNVKIDDHVEQAGLYINTAPLEKAGLMQSVLDAVGMVKGMTPEIVQETFQTKFSIKETLYNNLPAVARESLGPKATEEEVIKRMVAIYKLLDPISMMKNPTAPCSFGESTEEIINTPLTGGEPDED